MSNNGEFFCEIDVIAELANAHGGDRSKAVEMIHCISESADAAKIQVFTADDLAVEAHENYELYQELALSTDDLRAIIDAAHEDALYVFADVFGDEGLQRIIETDIDGFKIHSSDLTNHRLIEKVGREDKPTLVSAGGVTPMEINEALSRLERVTDAPLGLVYGFQNYPTKLEDAHLNRLRNLIHKYASEYWVGYASHVDGGTDDAKSLPAWAVAVGADFVEVHTTLDRSQEGPDYYSSLEPDAFHSMAAYVDRVKMSLGSNSLDMSESESNYRTNHKKCVVTTRTLSAGDSISEDDVVLKRPAENPKTTFRDIDDVIGKIVKQTVEAEEPVRTTDVEFRVTATLACRSESTRLYGKPLQLVGEEPILSHQISQLRKVNAIDEIVLAISDTPSKAAFIKFADKNNLSYIVGDENDVLGRIVEAGRTSGADLVVRTTTENPFLFYEAIDRVVEHAIAENADLAVTRDLPLGSFAEVISLRALHRAHEFGEDRHRSELVTSFITEHPESFDIVGIEPPETVRRPDVRLTVDNPCDLMLVRELWERVSEHDDPYDLETILQYYDNENLSTINEEKPDGTTPAVVGQSWHIYAESDERMTCIDWGDSKPFSQ
ncbi:N-acetylneuraminate synthase family protein [Halosegnis rubeus]|uniref:AFP-like domain-containing protein n=1 Tax=Halosegnis rubeus TaxID=2212850 RepID=A0A5N5UKV6_9EURY|nr:N-acetylneuraminate synthase family protein [Halosegnis rubeus]KAB7519449.1 hypothetical protein DP108_04930 [Halosegnis rubeus]